MPIVTLHLCAMNECVASSCCYVKFLSDGREFFQVMSGGYVGPYLNKVQNKNSTYPQNSNVWLSIAGDYSPTYTSCDTGWFEGKRYIIVPGIDGEEDTWIDFTSIRPELANCMHNTEKCTYYWYSEEFQDSMHVNSAVNHRTGGLDWAKPHTAFQFNS